MFQKVITSSPYVNPVLRKVYDLDPSLVTNALLSTWKKEDPTTLARIFDTLQELKALDRFLNEISNFSLALDLAILASTREFLNLEKWVTDKISNHGTPFIVSCMAYLADKIQSQRADGFPIEPTTVIFECLNACIEKRSMPPELVNDLKVLYRSFMSTTAPRRTNLSTPVLPQEAAVPISGKCPQISFEALFGFSLHEFLRVAGE